LKTYVVIPDLHIPFIDKIFIKVVNKAITILKPTGIIQLGDALDFWQVSRFEKDPSRKNTVMDDIALYNEIIDGWQKLLITGEFHQLEGNHEDRIRRYLWSFAKDLTGLVKPMSELLNFGKRSKEGFKSFWYPISQWDACKIGDAICHHGHYYNQHVAVGNLVKYPKKLITGHTHRFQYVADGNKFSVTLGHGSNEFETMHLPVPSNWQQAFGVLHVNHGVTSLDPILVNNGKAILYGEVLDAKETSKDKRSRP
jgi:hypothetical protein